MCSNCLLAEQPLMPPRLLVQAVGRITSKAYFQILRAVSSTCFRCLTMMSASPLLPLPPIEKFLPCNIGDTEFCLKNTYDVVRHISGILAKFIAEALSLRNCPYFLQQFGLRPGGFPTFSQTYGWTRTPVSELIAPINLSSALPISNPSSVVIGNACKINNTGPN